MNEIDENRVRNLLAHMRQEDPAALCRLLFDCILAKLPEPEFVASMKRTGDDGTTPDLAILIFKGEKPAAWALSRVEGMKRLADEMDDDSSAGGAVGEEEPQ